MTQPAISTPNLPSSNGARLVATDGRVLPLRGVAIRARASGGLCSLPPGARSSTSGPLALALGAVLGVTARRRRRVSRGARRPSH